MTVSIVESSKPGVIALINEGQVARPIQQQPTSTFFVVGYSPWGPVGVPRTITSWADYVRQFGGFDANSFLDDALYSFFLFREASQAQVVRVVGANSTKGTLTLKDRAGSPLDTLRVDAKYPSSRVDIKVTVSDGTKADTFKLRIRSAFFGSVAEVWDNLSIADQSSLDFVSQKSKYVTLTNLASGTAAPNNNPAVLAEDDLVGGDDKFSSLTDGSFVGSEGPPKSGLQALNDEIYGAGQVAIPGVTTDAAHAALIEHAENYHRLALLDPPLGSDKDDVVTSRSNYGTQYAAMYWPWVEESDYAGSGVKKFYPPSGFAAGACAQVDRTVGVHKAPANIRVPGAIDVERYSNGEVQVDDGTREFINSHDINAIAPLPNEGIKIYGARVLTDDRRVQFVHQIRLLNELYYSGKLGMAPFVFAVVGDRLFRDLRDTSNAFLETFWRAGALYGATAKEAFTVICDESNNPKEELDNGRVHVQWGVKISPTAEQIIINIDNVPLFQDLSVLQ